MALIPTRRAGDYAAQPIARAAGLLYWVDTTYAQMQAFWAPATDLDAQGTDHALVYVDGVQLVDRSNRRSAVFAVPTPGVVPHVAVVYVPVVCDWDNLYDPLNSDPLAWNCALTTAEVLVLLFLLLKTGTRATVKAAQCLFMQIGTIAKLRKESLLQHAEGTRSVAHATNFMQIEHGAESVLSEGGGVCVEQN